MVERIEMKLGMYAHYIIISTTITCFHDDRILFEKAPGAISLKILLHSSNLLTVARMEVKLGVHVYSMTTTTSNSLKHFCLKVLLHSSNFLTVACMEVKLGRHA